MRWVGSKQEQFVGLAGRWQNVDGARRGWMERLYMLNDRKVVTESEGEAGCSDSS